MARRAELGPMLAFLQSPDVTDFRVQPGAAEIAPFTPVNDTFLEEKKKENHSLVTNPEVISNLTFNANGQ